MREFSRILRKQMMADISSLPSSLRPGTRIARSLEGCLNIDDLRARARRSVPRAVFDFVDGAAGDEVTLQRNRIDFGNLALVPRAFGDVSAIETNTTVLGHEVDFPLLGAPTGLSGLVHHGGELALARAVHSTGGIYVMSAMASYTIEEVAVGATGPKWFQAYLWRDRGLVRDLVERAAAAGYLALVLTIDVPRAGARERDTRNDFRIPPRITLKGLGEGLLRPRWSVDFLRRPRIEIANAIGAGGGSSDAVSLSDYISQQFDPGLSWREFAWLREIWDGPLVVKGILRAEDADKAVRAGADAVIVSNHGGRQLDHAPSSIGALPAIADAVDGRAEVYLDGGVRRGSDIVKAIALGARACLVGRPLLYGLGAGGEAGAARAMKLLTDEFALTLMLLGCTRGRDLDRTWVAIDASPTGILGGVGAGPAARG